MGVLPASAQRLIRVDIDIEYLRQFTHAEKGHAIRSLMIGAEPWFLVSDVAYLLSIPYPHLILSEISEHLKRSFSFKGVTQGGFKHLIVNQSGLLRLIKFVDPVVAESFLDWIVEEVVPSMRQSRSYEIPVYLTS